MPRDTTPNYWGLYNYEHGVDTKYVTADSRGQSLILQGNVSDTSFTTSCGQIPPCRARLMMTGNRVVIPPPHVWLHSPYSPHSHTQFTVCVQTTTLRDASVLYAPGHGFVLQGCVSGTPINMSFEQLPRCSACFVMIGKRCLVPPPQLRLHSSNSPHSHSHGNIAWFSGFVSDMCIRYIRVYSYIVYKYKNH